MTTYTGWNYRIIKKTVKEEVVYGVHEVFYDASGSPKACTESPVEPWGESLDELIADIERMRAAADKPTLNYDDFSHDE